MTDFAADVESWHDFFMLAGTASATLLGLLFVGVSFRSDIRSQPEGSFMRTVVAHNFLSYLVVILFSLYFLIPDMDPPDLAWPIIITALFSFLSVLRSAVRLRSRFRSDREAAFWHMLVPMLCYLAAAGVGTAIIVHDDGAIAWMVTVTAFLLVTPTRNAWAMLVSSTETEGA